ncbi:hypothetical protein LTR10_009496 [Elasticomyces elasticus]|nr:hypothetical protein LTR10_009496 [Elasticomyces elasticus]KAK4971406.1 hypothetical protein LTR42_007134 [Elasticomyces elasticus]
MISAWVGGEVKMTAKENGAINTDRDITVLEAVHDTISVPASSGNATSDVKLAATWRSSAHQDLPPNNNSTEQSTAHHHHLAHWLTYLDEMSSVEDATAATITQNSPLLKLAPELRNAIYDYAIKGAMLHSAPDRIILRAPALGKVCRQFRREYKGVFKDEARRYAKELEIHVIDFVFYDHITNVGLPLHRRYDDVGALWSMPDWPRPLVRVHVVLTNDVEHSLPEMRKNLLESQLVVIRGVRIGINFDCRFALDPTTLDMEAINRIMEQEKGFLSRGHERLRYSKWWEIEEAFRRAVDAL